MLARALTLSEERGSSADPTDVAALARFHAGESAALERCYREHFHDVMSAAARVISGADAETVVHEVFYRLLTSREMRESFSGGSLGAWLARVARNAALDHARKRAREVPDGGRSLDVQRETAHDGHDESERVDAKLLVDRFRRERLPPEWRGVFDARFLRRMPQRDAASELGIPRSTLAHQEQRIRALLQAFLLGGGPR
jgi:RNA polymerase sigma-70 factor (ECF subfamily)